MSDRRTTVETLEGEPSAWPATLRDLLRETSDGPRSRSWLLECLGAGAADEATAGRRLEFLEDVAVVDCSGDGCAPGRYGREYLDTHDEAVLYEALDAGVVGFETLLEGLSVRPLTDVEMADLLSTAGVDAGSATAERYGAWLRALGYLSREDGLNELTRKGRRLVTTTEGLTPPGAGDDGPAAEPGDPRPDAGPSTPAAGPAGTLPVSRRTGPPPDDGESDAASDGTLEAELRARYDDTCMVCGDRRRRGPESGYAEVHYLMPPEAPHDGPAVAENAVVVCPNHRADFEHGTLTVDPRTLTVEHAYEPELSGRALPTVDGHEVGAQYLAYHNDVVAGE